MAFDDREDDDEKPVAEGETYEVEIEDLGSKGDGIARVDNFVVFVPDTEVGERVEIEIDSVGRKFAFGEVVDRLGEADTAAGADAGEETGETDEVADAGAAEPAGAMEDPEPHGAEEPIDPDAPAGEPLADEEGSDDEAEHEESADRPADDGAGDADEDDEEPELVDEDEPEGLSGAHGSVEDQF
ncbi:MAG: TRAM domain-containing protein [Candidatus Nanohaloarchaea archaeon]|nr:TRAM domain-containing protein [Candidatus Nanohaloarchaea archaeon]